jgi:hypothetical protein
MVVGTAMGDLLSEKSAHTRRPTPRTSDANRSSGDINANHIRNLSRFREDKTAALEINWSPVKIAEFGQVGQPEFTGSFKYALRRMTIKTFMNTMIACHVAM